MFYANLNLIELYVRHKPLCILCCFCLAQIKRGNAFYYSETFALRFLLSPLSFDFTQQCLVLAFMGDMKTEGEYIVAH